MPKCQECRQYTESGQGGVEHIKDGAVVGYTCEQCWKEVQIAEYKKTGEITSSLGMDAALASGYLLEGHDMSRLRSDFQEYIIKHRDTLIEIHQTVQGYHTAERIFENLHWLPRIQKYYNDSTDRGHSAKGDGFKALLWGCAGRVLLTLQDLYAQDNPKSKFGGAKVTMIFDETATVARGGIQSYIGTKDEVLGLLRAATVTELRFKPDKKVNIGI